MDSVESPHVLDYYAKHYRPGTVDLSSSSPPDSREPDGRMNYAPPGGLPALREAIAALYPGLSAEHVVVTNGASEALAATALALVRPGQRVSAGEEIYPSFRELAVRLGGVLSADDASLVAINNPTIPDGRLADTRLLVESTQAAGARLVADEVYLDLREGAPGMPAASISSSAISIGDLSKPLGLGGLRIGWAVCRDAAVIKAIGRSVQLLSGGPSVLAMNFALDAVNDYEPRLAARCAEAAANAPLVFAALEEAGWEFRPPEAGWTFLARPAQPLVASRLQALDAAGFFLMPGSIFGANGYRISLFAPVEPLRTALCLASSKATTGQALVVLAKATASGLAKTRLANDIQSDSAAELARAFLRDTIELSRTSGREVTIAFTPAEAAAEFSSMAPEAALIAQPDGDLGDRIGAALLSALRGQNSAILIGSDTPQLSCEVIDDAFRGLERADLVVGPATDGGFYLIGIGKPRSIEGLFDGIEWSTPRVFGQLLSNAQRLGRTVEVLEECTDIDDAKSLAAVLRQAAVSGSAPRTRTSASRLGLGLS